METALQVATLQELEVRIKAGLATFIDVGLCLLEIRDRRLYKDKGYTRFEDYCREQWGWSRDYGYKLIRSAETVKALGVDNCIQNEAQARELTPLVKADEQIAIETWRELKETHGANITAEIIKSAVQAKLKPEVPAKTTAQLIVSSNNNERYTPAMYVDAARRVMGSIDIDPATCQRANLTVNADVMFTAENDGLQHDWPGRVWLNPPYGGLTENFVIKLVDQHQQGITTEAILLVNSHATDTKWFQPLWDYILFFTDHRINFNTPGRDSGSGSTHGSVFIYLGPHRDVFAVEFSQFGVIVRRYAP